MNSIARYLPHGILVGALLALHAVTTTLFVDAVRAEEFSGQLWFSQSVETLPAPRMRAESKPELPADCLPAPTDRPLSELTTDVRPRDREGQVVPADGLPTDCASYVFTDHKFLSIGLDCESCRPKWCEVLRLAQFCHRPLYFEEACLERCGCKTCCCQPAASALSFYSRALFMPVTAICMCPCCTCVPAQYCCPPDCWR